MSKKNNNSGFSLIEYLFVLLIASVLLKNSYLNIKDNKNLKLCDLVRSEIISYNIQSLINKKKINLEAIVDNKIVIKEENKIIGNIDLKPLTINIKSTTIGGNNIISFNPSGSTSPSLIVIKNKLNTICTISLSLYGRTRLQKL